MTEKKYFTKPDLAKRKTFFSDIEALNKFSKINIHNMTDEKVKKFIENYPHLLMRDVAVTPFQDFMEIYGRYDQMMKTETGFQKVRSSLSYVQNTLLEKISEVRHSLGKTEHHQLLSFSGTVTVTFDPKAKKYIEIYMPEGFSPEVKIDTEMESKMISVKYFEVITYLCQELPPDRFKVCKKCGTPFFQATAREKLYCSIRCSKAVMQARKVKRDKEKENQKEVATTKNSKTK